MNQINLDKLFQLSPGQKADPAVLKLVVAQVYQAQVQQLTNGQFGLQLPAPRAPLQITLPANLPANVQAMLQSSVQTALAVTPGMPTQSPPPPATSPQANVQLQFLPQSNGQLQLVLQSASAPITLTLSAVQAQQLLSSVLSAGLPGFQPQPAAATQLPVNVLQQPQGLALQLGNGAVVRLPATTQAALMQQLSGSGAAGSLSADTKIAPPQVLLDIKAERQQLVLQLQILPANIKAAGTVVNANLATIPVTLNKAEQSAVLQQLLQLFNQPARSTTAVPAAAQQLLSQLSGSVNAGTQPYQLQLQQQASHWQLLLQPVKTSASVIITPEALSRTLQFNTDSNATAAKTPASTVQTPQTPNTQQLVQQAWRHLLPLMPVQADTLASLPELPPAVQQILQLVRQSQPAADKVPSPQQLISQLNSLLQFQPLQPSATAQTSGGALAAAIQLLLGHLLQKPLAAATQPANKPLAQLISQLEPGQASSLLRQLAGHSSTLQQSQLATLDSNNAQTQQLLLQLPMQQGSQSVFSQLLLEQREADGKHNGEKQTLWQLTMKFDLKQLGQLMVVAKLQQQQLQLQFYTDEMQAKLQADRFLPLLSDRCKAQGLEVTQAECTLGKIPDTILPRANSLLAIKV
ncbi:hook-length control protein FliK [Rheinheimera pacifica]|uniref:Hook-length control protein FliK n=1 Tax=Rheinheimera pacifica TaxID=173990 RepID=A0A1H6MCU7_9GAMM|nr:flagellar hook-length control protein FliK [Rheinheimera pacifica]SEH99377.1 hook-length control protein FliK [Rheinheimera pacifica]